MLGGITVDNEVAIAFSISCRLVISLPPMKYQYVFKHNDTEYCVDTLCYFNLYPTNAY